VWQRLHEQLLAELNAAGELDWSRAVIDSSHRAGAEGWPKTGLSPAGRAWPGPKHHLITEAHGIPLAVSLTGGNRNDVKNACRTLVQVHGGSPGIQGDVSMPLTCADETSMDVEGRRKTVISALENRWTPHPPLTCANAKL
jgi:hypothetical protein